MKKLLTILGLLVGIILFANTASADLKQNAIQSNNPKDLVAYINSTKAGKQVPVKKATNTEDDNYTVYVLKKKPKVSSLAQRTKFANNIQKIMNETPANFQRNGIAFYQGGSDGANFIIAFNKNKVAGDYGHAVQFSKLGNLGAGTTACYFEPFFARDDTNGAAKSSPSTQGKNAGPDGETLIEMIQDVTE